VTTAGGFPAALPPLEDARPAPQVRRAGRALSPRAAFWLAQVGGWTAYASSLFLTFLPAMEPGRRLAVFVNKELRALVGIVVSLGLLWLYRRVVADGEVSGRVAAIALAASIVAGIVGYFAHAALMVGVGLQPSFAIFLEPTTLPRSVLEFVFAFLVWSAAYFGVLVWRRSQEREREAAEARRLAQEAQLQMLAYQLNPHFLFNALTSIRAMIDEDRGRARQMVTQLAAFLRHALVERVLETTTLALELDALEGYLAIEQIRFEERLAIETRVDPAAEQCAIPAFLIHPLLENAIKHGAREATDGPLRVRLLAGVAAGVLRVEVWNTGSLAAGAPDAPSRGGDLGLIDLAPNGTSGAGIGVRNVRERLVRLFPGRHRFELTDEHGWVRAVVELPARAARSSPGAQH
jgi:two-component system, LytTR family, sensor kinase